MPTDIESIIKADYVGFHTVLYLCAANRHRLSSSFLMCVPFQICSLDISCNPSSHSDTPVAHSASQRINKEESIVTLKRANPISICSEFTIYLCCLRYLLLSCQDHNSITFLVVVEVTCASLTSRHTFLGKLRCELSSSDSLSLHQAFSAACGSFSLYPPLLQVKHGQKFC